MSGPASSRVVQAVAEATGRDPVSLPPLYETADPDALDALFPSGVDGVEQKGNGNAGDDREFRFTYAGHEISVRHNDVVIGPPTRSRAEQADE